MLASWSLVKPKGRDYLYSPLVRGRVAWAIGKEGGSHRHPWEVGWLWGEDNRGGSSAPLHTIVSGGLGDRWHGPGQGQGHHSAR